MIVMRKEVARGDDVVEFRVIKFLVDIARDQFATFMRPFIGASVKWKTNKTQCDLLQSMLIVHRLRMGYVANHAAVFRFLPTCWGDASA